MAKPAQTIYRLQLLDTELNEQRSRLREAEGMLGESRDLLAARRAHAEAEKELATWRLRLRDLEMDLSVLCDKIKATEQRMYGGRVTNPKELGALQQDHEHLKLTRARLEDEILTAMLHVEECEKSLREAFARREQVETKWKAEQEKLTREVEKLRARIAALSANRKDIAASLGSSELALYEELLRKKGGRAAVLLVNGMCQGCRVTLPTSKVQLVRQTQELVICTNCGRILVIEQ
jgi:hypothetical protein